MTEELKEAIKAKVRQHLSYEKLETNKFELKRQWPNLRDETELNEFLKDLTSIINAYGGEDAYMVFGVDQKSNTLYNTSIKDSGYSDTSHIKDVINSRIDEPFRFDIDYITMEDKNVVSNSPSSFG